ncbi:hypothetical protein AAG906_016714 [Vitis piasezkii]
MAMAVLSSSLPPLSNPLPPSTSSSNLCCPRIYLLLFLSPPPATLRPLIASQLCAPRPSKSINLHSLSPKLYPRTSFGPPPVSAFALSINLAHLTASILVGNMESKCIDDREAKDHKRYLAEREFEALKERVAGKREGFRRVSCINATIPLSQISSFSDDLCAACKFTDNGEDRVVVGTLDLNQCVRLPDEITGMKPQGIGADFLRAYLSNVCVAKELHRNGMGYALVAKSKMVAQEWGITDLYVHFAVDNEPAKQLYMKSGFIYENDEPAWQARFLERPRRILLWTGLPVNYDV